MIQITDKTQCCGCSACANACPVQCISMQPDEDGFRYPRADAARCINCGLCERVCPFINRYDPGDEKPLAACVARNRDREILERSSSGGFFFALCKVILSQQGVVYGAAFDENKRVVHMRAEREEDCLRFLGSKYVQSGIEGIFPRVKADLADGRTVCFSGTPCQVEGLHRFLGRDYSNLILVDIVCHGVASETVWRAYLDYEEDRHGGKVEQIAFRSKKYGYQSSTMMLSFGDRAIYETARVNPYTKLYYSNIALRPSCYHCAVKTEKRVSDFTIYDCWNAETLIGRDDNKGYTCLVIQSEKGEKLLPELSAYLELNAVKLEDMIPRNGGHMTHSTKYNPNREAFYREFREKGFKAAFDRYLKVSSKDQVVEIIKKRLTGSSLFRSMVRKRRSARRKFDEPGK